MTKDKKPLAFEYCSAHWVPLSVEVGGEIVRLLVKSARAEGKKERVQVLLEKAGATSGDATSGDATSAGGAIFAFFQVEENRLRHLTPQEKKTVESTLASWELKRVKQSTSRRIVDLLNRYGAEGWELILSRDRSDGGIDFYFKRPLG
jgi:hypothetical protein